MRVCGHGPLMGVDPAQCSLSMSSDVVVPVFCRGCIAASFRHRVSQTLWPLQQ